MANSDDRAHRSRWDQIPEHAIRGDIPADFVAVSENGYGMLIAWAAGPQRCIRVPTSPDDVPPVSENCYQPSSGTRTVSSRPRSAEDQRDIDDAIDRYLNEAVVPVAPHGYTWFVQVRSGDSEKHLSRAIGSSQQVEPTAVRDYLEHRYHDYIINS
ncbi:DUF5956 family protein [Gordonia sp. CPCC 206044]|uniref:DUF5956 family protein n=1 Tax=Gordonia sp. CPCC 206044 TaxID=3140793 RepID=UPI003AF363A8